MADLGFHLPSLVVYLVNFTVLLVALYLVGYKPILRMLVGKKIDHAIRDLSFSNVRITKDIKKTISSAVANAENNFQYDIDNLYIKEAYCGKSIIMKRFRPRAKGRASPLKKPYSNLTIILSEKTTTEEHGTKS